MSASSRPGGSLPMFLLLLPICWAPLAQSWSAAEAGEAAPQPGERELRAVLVVEAGAASGLGFLVEGSGLVVTSAQLAGAAQYIAVGDRAGRRFTAQPLVIDRINGAAILRVNELVTRGIQPLPLAGSRAQGDRPRKGDAVWLLSRSGGSRPQALATSVGRSDRLVVCYETTLAPEALGGPLLNAAGEVIGVNVVDSPLWRRRGTGCALPVHHVENALEAARQKIADVQPPPAGPLANLSTRFYPAELARELAERIEDPEEYRIPAGKVTLEFMTPPLIHALPRTHGDIYIPKRGFYQWERFAASPEPAVIVQAVPDVRWTAGSALRAAGYSVGVVLSVIPLGILGDGDLQQPMATYRFKRDFFQMQLLRDGVEVHPFEASLHCAPARLDVATEPAKNEKLRKIEGCVGVYKYPPEAFRRGGALTARIYQSGVSSDSREVPLRPELVERIWADFQPCFEAPDGRTESQRVCTTANPPDESRF